MTRLRFILILIVCGWLCPAIQAQEWDWVNPLPTGNWVRDICFTDDLHGLICGHYGIILKTTDGGTTWIQKHPGVKSNLYSIWMLNSTKGFISGDGVILRTNDGGETWQKQPAPPGVALEGVHFPTPDTGYAAGSNGTVLRTVNGGDTWAVISSGSLGNLHSVWFINGADGYVAENNPATFYGAIRKTTNAGVNWSSATGTVQHMRAIHFPTSSIGYAVGSMGMILKTTDSGNHWTSVHNSSNNLLLLDVYFSDPDHGIVTGEMNTILRTSDGGSTWSLIPNYTSNYYLSAWFPRPDTGWLLGAPYTNESFMAGIYNTTDGGITLHHHTHGYQTGIHSMILLPKGTLVACGDTGKVLRSENNGDSWNRINTPVYNSLNQILYANNTLWAFGGGGKIITSTDEGVSWTKRVSPTSLALNTAAFPTADTGYAAGDFGTLLKTVDGGNSWTLVQTGTMKHFYCITFFDGSHGILAGSGGICIKTSDGGLSWDSVSTNPHYIFRCMQFMDPLTGYATAGSFVLKTTDGGSTWQNVYQSPDYEEKFSLLFSDANTGFVAGDGGLIAKTSDGGINWEKQVSYTGSGLRALCITPGDYIFAAGDSGTILRSHDEHLGITEFQAGQTIMLHIFPVPARERITVSAETTGKNATLSLFNCLGIELRRQDVHGNVITLGLEDLPAGIYVVRWSSGKRSGTCKFIKE